MGSGIPGFGLFQGAICPGRFPSPAEMLPIRTDVRFRRLPALMPVSIEEGKSPWAFMTLPGLPPIIPILPFRPPIQHMAAETRCNYCRVLGCYVDI
mmetsp:Transcript_72694/g.134225  ORF Transcript_72694/g.134225 Transcript_72694/m.134225 type:complete len:96 (+) Transcript_72694:331-618(+)